MARRFIIHIIQDNVKLPSGARIRTDKTSFFQYLTQLIQNMILGHIG